MISDTEIESDMFLEKVDVSGHMSHRCHFFEALVPSLGGGPSPASEVLGPAGPNTKCCCFCVDCKGMCVSQSVTVVTVVCVCFV